MSLKETSISAVYRPTKLKRTKIKDEDNCHTSEASTSGSFPNGFLRAFAYKKEEVSNGYTPESPRRSLRSATGNITYAEKEREEKLSDHDESKTVKPFKRRRVFNKKAVDIKDLLDDEKQEYLPEVPDHVKEDMDILIIGSNPGRMSSRKCQHFSHPSNHFYKALHGSGLTPSRIPPSLDYTMLNQKDPYMSIGLTNLVARPTRMAHELNKTEESLGTEILVELCKRYRPKVGIFIGIGVSRSFERSLALIQAKDGVTSPKIKKEDDDEDARNTVSITISADIPVVSDKILGLGVGLMNVGIKHSSGHEYTLLYSMPSTSGRVTTHQLKEKTACMAWARTMTLQLKKAFSPRDLTKNVTIRLI